MSYSNELTVCCRAILLKSEQLSQDIIYHGFISSQGIKAKNVAEFIDNFSMTITKPTFIVLDNASVHTGGLMKESIEKWRARGLYIFIFLHTRHT